MREREAEQWADAPLYSDLPGGLRRLPLQTSQIVLSKSCVLQKEQEQYRKRGHRPESAEEASKKCRLSDASWSDSWKVLWQMTRLSPPPTNQPTDQLPGDLPAPITPYGGRRAEGKKRDAASCAWESNSCARNEFSLMSAWNNYGHVTVIVPGLT